MERGVLEFSDGRAVSNVSILGNLEVASILKKSVLKIKEYYRTRRSAFNAP